VVEIPCFCFGNTGAGLRLCLIKVSGVGSKSLIARVQESEYILGGIPVRNDGSHPSFLCGGPVVERGIVVSLQFYVEL